MPLIESGIELRDSWAERERSETHGIYAHENNLTYAVVKSLILLNNVQTRVKLTEVKKKLRVRKRLLFLSILQENPGDRLLITDSLLSFIMNELCRFPWRPVRCSTNWPLVRKSSRKSTKRCEDFFLIRRRHWRRRTWIRCITSKLSSKRCWGENSLSLLPLEKSAKIVISPSFFQEILHGYRQRTDSARR